VVTVSGRAGAGTAAQPAPASRRGRRSGTASRAPPKRGELAGQGAATGALAEKEVDGGGDLTSVE
jgi:hypothetical protein